MGRWGQRRGWTLPVGVASLLCFLIGSAPLARADDADRIRDVLRVQPGATCLSEDRLATEVARFLEGAPIPDDVTIAVKGSTSDPRGVRLHVQRMERTVAYRTFAPGPRSCEQLHEVVGLAIALALKAVAVEDATPSPAQETTAERTWSLGASALGTYRLLPELAPGLEVSVRRALGEYVVLRLGALGAVAWNVGLEERSGSFHAILAAGRVDGCARSGLGGAVYGAVCLGVVSGGLYAAGVDVPGQRSSLVPVIGLAGAVELELELSSRWSLTLGSSITWLLHTVQVGVESAGGTPGASRTLPRPGFAAGLGPVYHFE